MNRKLIDKVTFLKDYLLTYFFICFIAIFFVLDFIFPDNKFSENENRVLQIMPKFSVDTFFKGTFTKDYEEYCNDQFPFRNAFIMLKNHLEKVIGKKDSNGVYFAKDSYLIQKNTFSIYTPQLQKNEIALSSFCEKYKNVNVMIIPSASEILYNKLPKYALSNNEDNIIDNIKDDVINFGGSFINIYSSLSNIDDEYIFYRTDHHWTSYGAYVAFKEFMKNKGIIIDDSDYNRVIVSESFFGTSHSKLNMLGIIPDFIHIYKPIHETNYSVTFPDSNITTTVYDLDKINVKDKYQIFLGGNYPLIKIQNNGDYVFDKKLVIIKDSFANAFIPLLVDKYKEIDVIDFRMFNTSFAEYIGLQEPDYEFMILYNMYNFATDTNLYKLNK